jgi:hypothetical protein
MRTATAMATIASKVPMPQLSSGVKECHGYLRVDGESKEGWDDIGILAEHRSNCQEEWDGILLVLDHVDPVEGSLRSNICSNSRLKY